MWGQPELCSYWLTQNRHSLWLVIHKTALQWYERLAGSSVTKLIGQQQLSAWFLHLPERRCFISTKNQRFLRKIQNQPRHLLRPTSVNFRQHCQNLSHETVPLSWRSVAQLFKSRSIMCLHKIITGLETIGLFIRQPECGLLSRVQEGSKRVPSK